MTRLTALGMTALAAPALLAQSVVLQIRPRVGDTLAMRLDQQTEMIGVRKTGNKASSGSVLNMMSMFSRAIVEQGSAAGSTVLTVTDSVRLSTSDEKGKASAAAAERQWRGQQARLRVAPDGTVEVVADKSDASRE